MNTKINIDSVAYLDSVLTLCRELNMPDKVTERIANIYKTLDFKPIMDSFNGLFSVETGKESSAAIIEHFKNEQDGLSVLAVYLTAAFVSREEYKKRGINDKIYLDTMKIFTRFTGEYLKSYGKYGFDRGWWNYRNTSLSLFRLGELEFEMCRLNKDKSKLIKEGTSVISVHIPSDAKLSREMLDRSYSAAKEFFSKHYGEYDYSFFCCESWLLSPVLKKLLPPESKIIEFQRDYDIVSYDESDKSFMEWVYKKEYEDYDELTENTSLERNIKKHLLSGGAIGSAFGILSINYNSEDI